MKFTAQRGAFADALSTVAPALLTKSTSAAHSAVRLVLTDGTLTVTGSGPELTIVAQTVELGKSTDGTVHTSGHRLRDLVSKFTAPDVHVEHDGQVLVVKSGRSSYRLPVFPADEFPPLPAVPPKVGVAAAEDLHAAMAWVNHAATDDDKAGPAAGVILETADDRLFVAATDRFRIGITPVPWAGTDVRLKLPKASLQACTRGLRGDVTIHADDRLITFADSHVSITCRLLAGEPLAWTKFADLQPSVTHTVDVEELAAALERLSLVVEVNDPVHVELTPDEATISARFATSAVETVPVEGTAAFDFWIFPRYLRDLLASVDTPHALLGTGCARSPKAAEVRALRDGQASRATQVCMFRDEPKG